MNEPEQIQELGAAFVSAWDANDVDAIVASGGGAGFGFRTRDVRLLDYQDPSVDQRAFLQMWFDSLDYYRIVDFDSDVRIEGDTAIESGTFTEEFQQTGEQPERVRVRSTAVYRRQGSTWERLWDHRDAQEFTSDGVYVKRPVS